MDSGLLSVILSVFGIAITLLVYRLQISPRRISYEVISNSPVVSISQAVKDRVQVQFEGQLVKEVHQVVISLCNSGDQFVSAKDFVSPIKFEFGNAQILDLPKILNTEPHDLRERVSIRCDESKKFVIMEPLLLNKNDSILWSVLLTGFTGIINVEGTIAGVRGIRRIHHRPYITAIYWLTKRPFTMYSSHKQHTKDFERAE